MKKFFTLLAAFIASSAMMAQDWENAFPNSDCEGTDFSGFAVKPNKIDGAANSEILTGEQITPAAGKGVDGSQCISVLSAAGAATDWDAQLWIMVPAGKTLDVTDKFKVTFQYRCESEAFADESFEGFSIDTQAHGAPGNYHHYQCIGSVEFPNQEWQTFEAEATVGSNWTGDDGFQSIAFNLSKIKDYDVTFYIDNVTFEFEHQEVELVPYWNSIVSGGKFDAIGEEQKNFTIWERGGYRGYAIPEEGIGNEGEDGTPSGGIKVVVPAKAEQTWDSQFFISFNEPIASGEIIKVKFDYKASEAVSTGIDTQAHASAPGSYNHYQCIGTINFTEEWKTYEYTLVVTDDMSKNDGDFQNIAFNMAVADHEVTYYFDNITVAHRIMVDPSENPELLLLRQTLDEIDAKYGTLDSYKANAELRNAFAEALENARNAEEELAEVRDALIEAESKFSGSISDYNKLNNFIKWAEGKMATAEAMGANYTEMKDQIDEAISELYAQYDNEEWTRAEINAATDQATIKKIISDYLAAHVQDGDDITILLENPDFAGNTNGWQRDGGSKFLDYGPSNRNTLDMEDGHDGFLPTGMAEVWHGSYNAYQVLQNLPAGLYTLTVNACQRGDEGSNETAVLYASANGQETTQLIMSVYADPAPEALFETDGVMQNGETNSGTWPSIENPNGEGWIPNGKGSANYHLNAGYYLNTVNILLEEGGDLRIGLKDDNTTGWVVMDNFKVVYKSLENVEAFAAAVQNQLNRIDALRSAEGNEMTGPAEDALQDGFAAGEALLEGAYTIESCKAMIDRLVAAYDDAVANINTMKLLEPAYENFYNSYFEYVDNGDEVLCTDAVAKDAIANDAIYNDGTYTEYTTEQLAEYINKLNYLTDAMKVTKDVADASDANPVELLIFQNPDFEDYAEVGANKNYPGWSGSGFGTGGGTAGPVGERWNQSNGFNTYVTFHGLPEGSYVLSCDGAYRTSLSNDVNIAAGTATTENEAFLYATTSLGTTQNALYNIATGGFTEAECEELGLPTSSDIGSFNITTVTDSLLNEETNEMEYIKETTKYIVPDQLYTADLWIQAGKYTNNNVAFVVPADGTVTVGVKRKGQSNDWCFVDNFKLTYYGVGSQVAIQNVEATPVVKGIYTISGMRVQNISKPGLYIVNGKKVLVK